MSDWKNSGWAYVNRGFYPVSAEREWVQVIKLILYCAIINTTLKYLLLLGKAHQALQNPQVWC